MTAPLSQDRWRRAVLVTAVLVVCLGVGVSVLGIAGREPADPVLGSVALGVVVAGPGLLALLGLNGRPLLWLAAGLAASPLSLISFVTLPLFLAGVVLVLAWARRASLASLSRLRRMIVIPLVTGLLVLAFLALFLTEDPVKWETPSGGGESSDVISNGEAMLSLAFVSLGLGTAWRLLPPQIESGKGESGANID